MFNTIKKITAISIVAVAVSANAPAQQLDVGTNLPAQQRDGVADSQPGVAVERAHSVLGDNITPDTRFVLFIGDGPNSPILLLDGGIVPDSGTLLLNMGIGLHHDSKLGVYFQSEEVTIFCPTAGDDDAITPSHNLSLQVADKGTAQLVLDVISNGDQGAGLRGQGAAYGLNQEAGSAGSSGTIAPSHDMSKQVADKWVPTQAAPGAVSNGGQGLALRGQGAAYGLNQEAGSAGNSGTITPSHDMSKQVADKWVPTQAAPGAMSSGGQGLGLGAQVASKDSDSGGDKLIVHRPAGQNAFPGILSTSAP